MAIWRPMEKDAFMLGLSVVANQASKAHRTNIVDALQTCQWFQPPLYPPNGKEEDFLGTLETIVSRTKSGNDSGLSFFSFVERAWKEYQDILTTQAALARRNKYLESSNKHC